MNNKCRKVDVRGIPPFFLPGGPVVGSRNYEHMSRGWWVNDYGTNPTHEPTETH